MASLRKQINDRFVKIIRNSYAPCPLMGDKWLQEFPHGRPADFRYFGARKLAKATGLPALAVAKMLSRNVSVSELGLTLKVAKDGVIDLNFKEGKRPADLPSEPPPKPVKTRNKKNIKAKGAK